MSTNGGDVYPEAGAPGPPAHDRRQQDVAAARLTEEVGQLREGISILIGRVESMTEQYQTIADLQRRQQDVDGKAAEAVREAANAIAETKRLDRTKVSTTDHEEAWRVEQQKLIRTRLSIRRQTYIIGAAFFVVSMVVLTIVTALLIKDIHNNTRTRTIDALKRCEQGNQFRAGDRQLWQEVISLSTTKHQTPRQAETTRKFIDFLSKHDALVDCSKVGSNG